MKKIIPWKIPIRENCYSQKVYGIFFPLRHLLFNYEKVKVCHGKVNNSDYCSPKVNDKFDSVWSNNLSKTQHTVAMEPNLENYDFGLQDSNVKIRSTDNAIKSHKCNQCDYASSNAGHLRTHLKAHNGEKSKKCNQCDYASSQAGNLRRHLKTHRGEK